MYSSTEEYLDALRKGDYLQALTWLEFIVAHYSIEDGDADTLLQLAIFELIHHGFSESDFHHIEILYTLLYEQTPPFVGIIAYNATVLCEAAMQYIVFLEHNLLKFYSSERSLDTRATVAWMHRTDPSLDCGRNSEELMKKYTDLNNAVANLQEEASLILAKINYILECQQLLQIYVEQFLDESAKIQEKSGGSVKNEEDEKLAAMRFGIITSLKNFLKDKTIVTPEIIETTNTFASAVIKMNPYEWEEELLVKLISKSLREKPFISWFFDKSAEKFQFFAVKMIKSILPIVDVKESPPSDNQPGKS